MAIPMRWIPYLRERGVAAEAFRTDFGSEE